MEVILAAVRPKHHVNGLDYRPKLYDILLLDHKNVDKTAKPTKYFPAFPITAEEEPRDEILRHLYKLTGESHAGGDHGGIKGERALLIPWNNRENHRESLSRFSLFCIPISPRDKLNSSFVEKSPNSPGFYSLDNLIHSLNSNSMNFPPPTRTFVTHLESWLKEKHSKPGALDIVFRSRADFRIAVSVNNPVFLPYSMSSSMRTDVPEEIRATANELFAGMMEIEKCHKVVINPLFGSTLASKARPSWPWPSPDYVDSSPASRKSSLESINFDERDLYPLHRYAAKGDYMKLQECLTRGFAVSKRDSYGWDALHYAARYGNKDAVQLLLHRGCDPNVVTVDDQTPLHLAASKGYLSVVNVLLSHPEIDINVVDKMGCTALDMCKNKLGWEHIQISKKLEIAMQQPMQIPVYLMDGSSQSLGLVDGANTTVQQLNQQMLRVFNMPETPYADIFTIWLCGHSLELQLKPEHKPIEHMSDWTQRLVSMLTDGDPKQEKPCLKWRRNAKISLIVEREVMHTDAIRLLFHEARINYIDALYPCKEQDVLILASILLYLDYGGSDMSAVKRFLSVSSNLASLVPAPMQKSIRGNKILHQFRELSGQVTERNEARLKSILYKKFLDSCRNLTVYGSAFFTGSLQIDNSKMVKCFIGVNDVGLHIINAVTRLMLHTYKYSEVSWGMTPDLGVQLDVRVNRNDIKNTQGNTPTVLKLRSKQAGMINHLMKKLSHINSYYGGAGYQRQRVVNTK